MKRLLAVLLAFCLLVGCTGCQMLENLFNPTPEPMPAGTPFAEKYAEKLSILIIGNSHSVDAFHLLYQAYKDQYPDVDLCVGILHYGGACIDEHVEFLKSGEEVIRYYKNDSGKWKIKYRMTSEYVLKDEPWDVVLTQPAKEDLSDETLNQDGRWELQELVNQHLTHPHEFMWHISWPSPNDEVFFSPDYVRQPPEGYKKKLTRLYGFNPVNQFGVMLDQTRKNVLEDDHYTNALCSGSAVMHSLLVQGLPQLDLWRDYTHLSDYGRLMASYALVAQLNQRPLEDIGIDLITEGWRHKQNQVYGNLHITQEMEDVLIKAVNYSLEHRWEMPQKQGNTATTTTTTTTRRTTWWTTRATTRPTTTAAPTTTTTTTTVTEDTTTTTLGEDTTTDTTASTDPTDTTDTTETADTTDTTDTTVSTDPTDTTETTDTTTATTSAEDTTTTVAQPTEPTTVE